MRPTLQLKMGQQLTMTPQLQQAIRLLQLSSLELQAEIQDALDSNPLLDSDEGNNEQAESIDDGKEKELTNESSAAEDDVEWS